MFKPLPSLVVAMTAGALLSAQDDPLKTARDLYASAAYEEALAELTHAAGSAPAAAETARDVDAYRAFCLVALGRTAEARTVAESLVRKDPMFAIDGYRDASPRIVTLFETARARVLPQLIREEYRTARALSADKAPEAGARLAYVRQLLDEARASGIKDETLDDLRLLVDGFLELSRDAAPVASAPQSVDPPPAPDVSVNEAADVVAPIAVAQPMPRVPPALFDVMKALRRPGMIDVVINERGTVDDVIVRKSLNAAYDTLLVAAARQWRYQPATKDGQPVRYVKTVAVNVQLP